MKKVPIKFDGESNFFPDDEERVHLNFTGSKRVKNFEKFTNELRKIREKKHYPFIDKKINTAWNSMMIEALFKASAIDDRYQKMAQRHLDALSAKMFDKSKDASKHRKISTLRRELHL